MSMIGCDISQFQGAVNFDQLKTSAGFVFIRAGYTNGSDSQFKRNQSEARRVGIPRGYYWFTYPDRIHNSQADADQFVNTVGELQAGEIMILDFEVGSGDPAYCRDFLNRVRERTGLQPKSCWLYTNQNRTITLNWSPVRDTGYPLWVAYFDNAPNNQINTNGWGYPMKQYTADGRLFGIDGAVDLDIFYGDNLNQYGKEGQVVIQNADNWRGRVNRTVMAFWGRPFTEAEFQSVVGKDTLALLEILGDNPETDNNIHRAQVGQTAISGNWESEIGELSTQLQTTNDKLKEITPKAALSDKLQKQVSDLTKKNQELLKQKTDDTKLLDDTTNIFQRILNRIFKKK